jgi:hypothetical protein
MRDLSPDDTRRVGLATVVRTLAPDDRAENERWDAFVERCPAATFFHRAGWQRIIGSVFRHRTWFLYAERDGVIEGVLPLARIKSVLFGHSLVSLPFGVYGGVAATSDEAAGALEAEAQRLAVELGVAHLAAPVRDLPQGDPARCGRQHAGDPAQAAGDGEEGHQE